MSGNTEPLCDRISSIAEQLENAATDLRGMPGVSRLRAALPAAVADLRNIAERVLEQGAELDDLRAERDQLRPEYGVRVVYTSTRMREEAVSDNADDAREQAAKIAESHNVVSAIPIQRPVGGWEKVDNRG